MFGEIISDGNGGLTYRTLAGAAGDGLPVGTIIAVYSSHVPGGFLPCNGVEFDTTQYSALYLLLGSNKTPDLRECTLVGTGLSTRPEITVHDNYTVGQFKLDQAALPDGYASNGTGAITNKGYVVGEAYTAGSGITRSRSIGVNYCIKSTVGAVGITDPDIYNDIVGYIDEHFVMCNKDDLTNGCLVKYDSAAQAFVAVDTPTVPGSVLTADVETSEDWSFNGAKYDDSLVEVTNAETPDYTVTIGQMTTVHMTYRTDFDGILYLLGNGTWIDKNTNGVTTPTYYYERNNELLTFELVEDSSNYYVKDSTDWYLVKRIDYDTVVKGAKVTDATLITTLDAATPVSVTLENILKRTFQTVTGFTSTALTVTDIAESSDYDTYYAIPASSYLPVVYNLYYGTDFTYQWKAADGNGKGIAFIGTTADYEIAKLIAEGQPGHIPSSSAVILTDAKYVLRGEDK